MNILIEVLQNIFLKLRKSVQNAIWPSNDLAF